MTREHSIYGEYGCSGIESDYLSDENYTEPEYKAADFKVLSYDIDMKIRESLTADVSMDLTPSNEYSFTLYHGLNIHKLTDGEGKALDYKRSGDYVYILSDVTGSAINIQYSGLVGNYYIDREAAYISRNFPYYPVPGINPLYTEYEEYIPVVLGEAAEFNVNIDSLFKVYSNLEERPDGSYYGYARGMTLYGGVFVKEYEKDGVSICYSDVSYVDYSPEALDAFILKMQNDYGMSLKGKRIFSTGMSCGKYSCSIYKDSVEIAGYRGLGAIIDVYTDEGTVYGGYVEEGSL